MQAQGKTAKTPASLGLFECFALAAALVLQTASFMTSLQGHNCGAAPAAGQAPAAEARSTAAPGCRG
jgi:hypothetical protein